VLIATPSITPVERLCNSNLKGKAIIMPGGKRPGAGRKRHKIDLVELEKLCSLQCTDAELASFLGVSIRTLERRKENSAFLEVMEKGRAAGKLSVRRMLFALAVKGNVAAAIFLAKNILGYRDVVNTELTGANGGPVQVNEQIDLKQFSKEDLEQLRTILKKAAIA
jgi:hypothetical protein